MLNTEHCHVLAGNPERWDAETRQRCRPGIYKDTYESEDLCAVQVDQHRRGYRSAQLCSTIYGWSVRAGSNLDSPQLLYGYRLTGQRASRQEAIDWGIAWANQDPEHREFYASKRDIADLLGKET